MSVGPIVAMDARADVGERSSRSAGIRSSRSMRPWGSGLLAPWIMAHAIGELFQRRDYQPRAYPLPAEDLQLAWHPAHLLRRLGRDCLADRYGLPLRRVSIM
jgi:hypothetical protein